MVYLIHERPAVSTAFVLGIQHALVLLMLTVYVVIGGRDIGLSEAELRSFISVQIIVLGVGTLILGLRTRFSSGQLIVHTPSIISAGTFVLVVNSYGIGAAGAALIVSGIIILILSRFLSHLQSVFPPEVTGVLLFLLGLSLVEGGITRFTGIDNGTINSSSVLIAFTVQACIVAFPIWAKEAVSFVTD